MRISDWSSDVCSSDLLVFNRYFDLSPEDEPGLPLLPLFLSMRAAVLTHVLALQAQGAGNKELAAQAQADRKSVVSGKSVSVRVDLGVRRIIKQKNTQHA